MLEKFNQSFDKWLGEGMASEVAKAQFKPAEINNKHMLYRYEQGVLVDCIDPDIENREKIIQHYLKFFEEIIDALLIQAAEMLSTIVIDPDLGAELIDNCHTMFTKALSGDEKYRPWMNTLDYYGGREAYLELGNNQEEWVKKFRVGVLITLYMGITKPTKDMPSMLVGFFMAEGQESDKDNPSIMNKVANIECSWDYDKRPEVDDDE